MISLYQAAKSWLRGVTFFSSCLSAIRLSRQHCSGTVRSGCQCGSIINKDSLRTRQPTGENSMKHRITIAAAAVLLATTLGPAYAQRPTVPPPAPAPGLRTIEVRGHGEAHATPDLAFLNLAIETHAVTAQECANLNADLAQKVVRALEVKLQGKGRVWTGGYSLYPEYANEMNQKKPAIIGYRAENSITVQTGAIDLLGG